MTSLARTGNYCLQKSKRPSIYNSPNQVIEGFIVNYGYATVYDVAVQKEDVIEALSIPFKSEYDAKRYAKLITTKGNQCFSCKALIKVDKESIFTLLKRVQESEEKLVNLLEGVQDEN